MNFTVTFHIMVKIKFNPKQCKVLMHCLQAFLIILLDCLEIMSLYLEIQTGRNYA